MRCDGDDVDDRCRYDDAGHADESCKVCELLVKCNYPGSANECLFNASFVLQWFNILSRLNFVVLFRYIFVS